MRTRAMEAVHVHPLVIGENTVETSNGVNEGEWYSNS